MGFWPVHLDMTGRRCLVVGGGEVGLRKVRNLLAVGAEVALVARALWPELQSLVDEGRLTYLGAEYHPDQVKDRLFVFAAASDPGLNARIAADAAAAGAFVNAADRPEACTLVVPAVVSRGDLVVSVGTGSRSPALAKRIRGELEDRYGEEYALLTDLLGRVREKVLARGRPSRENRVLFRALVESDLARRLAAADHAGADRLLLDILGPGFTLKELGFSLDEEGF